MFRSLSALLLTVSAIAACAPSAPVPGGAMLFAQNCSSCHGTAGLGDGPRAPEQAVRPANLTMLRARNGGIFPADAVIAQIYGYAGRHDFGGMPEFGQEFGGPMVDWVSSDGTVIPTPRALIALADYIETIQQ